MRRVTIFYEKLFLVQVNVENGKKTYIYRPLFEYRYVKSNEELGF